MHQIDHVERHFTSSELVRDIVIGMSDGLTVPFALAAGLSGTDLATSVVVTAGLAEVAAGSIAMGLGGYLAAKSDAEHYAKEREREKREVAEIPHEEMREVAEVFQAYGLTEDETWPIVQALKRQPRNWMFNACVQRISVWELSALASQVVPESPQLSTAKKCHRSPGGRLP